MAKFKNLGKKNFILYPAPYNYCLSLVGDSLEALQKLWLYVKSVRIRSYSGPYFPTFGQNMERYGVFLCIQSECGKIRTIIFLNTDTFYAVWFSTKFPQLEIKWNYGILCSEVLCMKMLEMLKKFIQGPMVIVIVGWKLKFWVCAL